MNFFHCDPVAHNGSRSVTPRTRVDAVLSSRTFLIACQEMILYLSMANRLLGSVSAQDLAGPGQKSGLAEERFVINGTGDRHNPLRRKVSLPGDSNEVYVLFKFRESK